MYIDIREQSPVGHGTGVLGVVATADGVGAVAWGVADSAGLAV
jgi:hypothetical protein